MTVAAAQRFTPLVTALWYAAQGLYVGPQYATTADGSCTCRRRAGCDKPGKHPNTDACPRGSLDYTTDPETIRRWWTTYPDAGIGYDPARSDIVDIAPDSWEQQCEFERLGIPAGAAAFRSSHTPGHVHYLTRRPEGCPVWRINRSGDFDLLANGNSVLPPTLDGDGPRAWLTPAPNLNGALPDAPAWAVTMLREAATRKQRQSEHRREAGGDAEPPVRLADGELAWWRGERVLHRPDESDTVDRSRSLLMIGRVLFESGATRRAIVPALRARDHALGWHKYCERSDGDAQYHAIVDELEAAGLRQPEALRRGDAKFAIDAESDVGGVPAGRADAARLAELERENAALRERVRYLEQLQSKTMAALSNPNLAAQEKITAIRAVFDVASAQRRGKDNDGFVRVAIAGAEGLARRAGCSPKRAGEQLATIAATGQVFERIVGPAEHEGQIRTAVRVRLKGNELEALDALARLEPPGGAAPKNGHGGKRVPRCPDHPVAAVLKRVETTLICAVCGQVVDGPTTETVTVPPAPPEGVGFQDGTVGIRTYGFQDGTLHNGAPPGWYASSESPEWYTPPHIIDRVVRVLGSIDLDPCSNSHDAPNVPATRHYTRESDGPAQRWEGRVYLNPPYGRGLAAWVDKLCDSYAAGCVHEAVALLPAGPDTQWYQRLRQYPRCFLTGRLKFGSPQGGGGGATFASLVVYLGPHGERFRAAFADLGDLWEGKPP